MLLHLAYVDVVWVLGQNFQFEVLVFGVLLRAVHDVLDNYVLFLLTSELVVVKAFGRLEKRHLDLAIEGVYQQEIYNVLLLVLVVRQEGKAAGSFNVEVVRIETNILKLVELNVVNEDFTLWQAVNILFAVCQSILNDQFVLPNVVKHDWEHTVVPLTSSLSWNLLKFVGICLI